jgi:RES domain-containing protein
MIVAYRHAAYDTPWLVNPSRRAGRFHRALDAVTQYLALHPLGPSAEVVTHAFGRGVAPDDVAALRLQLWAVLVDDAEVLRVGFGEAAEHGIEPDALVGDDYTRTQAWADELRAAEVPGVVVPSAALPGTENLVLFGPRVAHPYLLDARTAVEVRTGHLTDAARAPAEVLGVARWPGEAHPALAQWRATGTVAPLVDPASVRY